MTRSGTPRWRKNVQWILNEKEAAGRVMLWAHNAHIQHPSERLWGWLPGDVALGYSPMGTHLKKILGRDYLAFGFCLRSGWIFGRCR